MKKAFLIVFVSFTLSLLIIIGSQLVLAKAGGKGELQITSIPDAKVYMDNQYIGKTPICRCASVDQQSILDAKTYTVKLIPVSGDTTPYYEQVTIAKGVLAVVDHTFAGVTQSEGSTLELDPLAVKTDSSVILTSFPSGVTVLLDNNPVGITPLSLAKPTESDHTLTVKKQGYKDKTLHIRTPLGYRLHVIIYLAIDPTASTQNISSSDMTATAAAIIVPSPSVAKVTILDTPTGFLRVRAEASLGSAEVEQVKPGDSLYYLSEQNGWYQVKLPDSKIGWVNTQYAKKE